jgi:hypothetical protein
MAEGAIYVGRDNLWVCDESKYAWTAGQLKLPVIGFLQMFVLREFRIVLLT